MAYRGESAISDRRNWTPAFFPPPYDREFLKFRMRDGSMPFRYDKTVVPQEAILKGGRETIPDFLSINGCLAMSDRARLLIESFEPNLHQFVPVEIVSRTRGRTLKTYDGHRIDKPYFLFAPQTNIDAVWIERSAELKITDIKDGTQRVSVPDWHLDKVVLRKSLIEGHHIWIGKYHMSLNLMFSDSIVAAIKEARLQKLVFTYVREE